MRSFKSHHVRGKVCLPKMQHPECEVDVMPKTDECQECVWLKFRYYLRSIIMHRQCFNYMYTDRGDSL